MKIEFEDSLTKCWILNSLCKISTLENVDNNTIENLFNHCANSKFLEIFQMLNEYKNVKLYRNGLINSSKFKEDKFDKDLTFLDDFVNKSILEGAKLPQKRKENLNDVIKKRNSETELKTKPYGSQKDLLKENETNDSELKIKGPRKWRKNGFF